MARRETNRIHHTRDTGKTGRSIPDNKPSREDRDRRRAELKQRKQERLQQAVSRQIEMGSQSYLHDFEPSIALNGPYVAFFYSIMLACPGRLSGIEIFIDRVVDAQTIYLQVWVNGRAEIETLLNEGENKLPAMESPVPVRISLSLSLESQMNKPPALIRNSVNRDENAIVDSKSAVVTGVWMAAFYEYARNLGGPVHAGT